MYGARCHVGEASWNLLLRLCRRCEMIGTSLPCCNALIQHVRGKQRRTRTWFKTQMRNERLRASMPATMPLPPAPAGSRRLDAMAANGANRTLAGRTLFITGASRGIGLAIALRAARDGANVAIAAKTTEPHPKLPG